MSQPMLSSKAPFIHRARKAFLAGAGAAVTAVIAGLSTEIPRTNEGWVALITGALVAGIVMGWSTYKIRNTATVEGSDPLPQPVAPPAEPRPQRWPETR